MTEPGKKDARDWLDAAIGFCCAAAVTGIGLDEFNVSAGLFTVKISLIFLVAAYGLVLFRLLLGRGLPRPFNMVAFVFLAYLVFVDILFYSGLITPLPFEGLFTASTASLTRTFNLVMLASFAYIGAHFMSVRQLYWGAVGLICLQCCVFAYIVVLLIRGDVLNLNFLPGGIPRFSLNLGGMTPNQMGAMWLAPTLVLGCIYFHCGGSKWQWLPIIVGALGAISTESRSMMIGIALLAITYTVLRPRMVSVIAVGTSVIVGLAAFVTYQSSRIADASAGVRLTKWADALANFQANILFGSSFGTIPAPHSAWVQLLSETGLIGFTLAVLMILQTFIGDGTRPRLAYQLVMLVFLPYLFFVSVDIPILQWQTWLIPITFGVGYRHFAENPRPERRFSAAAAQ